MSRTRRFLGGVSMAFAYQIAAVLVGLWLTPFFLRHLGQHDFGLWAIATQIVGYLALLDFGVIALLPRETAYATGRAASGAGGEKVGEVLALGLRLAFWQTPAVAVVAAAVWLLLPADWSPLRLPLALVLAAFVLLFPTRLFQGALQGLQDLAFVGLARNLIWIGATVLTAALVWVGWKLEALAVGWVTTQTLLAAVLWRRLRRRFPDALGPRLPRVAWSRARDFLRRSVWASMAQIAQILLVGTDVLILGAVFGPTAIVPYVLTGKLIAVLTNQPQIVMQTALPGLSELKTGASRERLVRVTEALALGMMTLSGAVFCSILAVNEGFIGWWVGTEHFGGLKLTVLLLAAMILRHWNTTAVYSLFCFGHERRLALTTLLDGLITVAGTFALIPFLGPLGAPIGAIFGSSLASLPLNLSALAREGAGSVGALIRPLLPWAWRFVPLAALAAWTARSLRPAGLIEIAVASSAIFVIYSAVMLPVVLRSELGVYLRPRLDTLRAFVAAALGRSRPASPSADGSSRLPKE